MIELNALNAYDDQQQQPERAEAAAISELCVSQRVSVTHALSVLTCKQWHTHKPATVRLYGIVCAQCQTKEGGLAEQTDAPKCGAWRR